MAELHKLSFSGAARTCDTVRLIIILYHSTCSNLAHGFMRLALLLSTYRTIATCATNDVNSTAVPTMLEFIPMAAASFPSDSRNDCSSLSMLLYSRKRKRREAAQRLRKEREKVVLDFAHATYPALHAMIRIALLVQPQLCRRAWDINRKAEPALDQVAQVHHAAKANVLAGHVPLVCTELDDSTREVVGPERVVDSLQSCPRTLTHSLADAGSRARTMVALDNVLVVADTLIAVALVDVTFRANARIWR